MTEEYWKIKSLQELFDIEKKSKEKTTITKSYLETMKSKIKLMKEAQEFGENKMLDKCIKIIDEGIDKILKEFKLNETESKQ